MILDVGRSLMLISLQNREIGIIISIMSFNFKFKQLVILAGDFVLFYVALIFALMLRYGFSGWRESFLVHFRLFSWLLPIWLAIFYLADLHQVKILKSELNLIGNLFWSVAAGAAISALIFYFSAPLFQLTPKTNLVVFGFLFGLLVYLWRLFLVDSRFFRGWRSRLLIIGNSSSLEAAVSYLRLNPLFGYEIVSQLKNDDLQKQKISQIIVEKKIDVLIILPQLKKEFGLMKTIYQLLPRKLTIIDAVSFYETIFRKIPLEELEELWFIEKIIGRKPLFDAMKRIIDIFLSFCLGFIFSPLMFLIVVLLKITAPQSPAIFKQRRTGKNNQVFWLYKFRTMNHQAGKQEAGGPLWTAENDHRLTVLGKFLRFTHLDELPQLFNILRGDIAFVGPRAERAELTEQYKELPFYEIRHIVKPGLTGWAQICYRPSASLQEAFEKLKYDIYYIKNRSLFLDLLIIFKTIRMLFSQAK